MKVWIVVGFDYDNSDIEIDSVFISEVKAQIRSAEMDSKSDLDYYVYGKEVEDTEEGG